MNQKLKWALYVGIVLCISGCEGLKDQTNYEGSEFSKLHISELHKGYMIDGGGDYNGDSGYLYLYFCKNNRYKFGFTRGKVDEGDFTIDTQKGTVTLIGDDTDKTGSPVQGVLSTGNGYIAQKKKLQVIGSNIDLEMQRVYKINSSDCNPASR